jgi:hypothetical protein
MLLNGGRTKRAVEPKLSHRGQVPQSLAVNL